MAGANGLDGLECVRLEKIPGEPGERLARGLVSDAVPDRRQAPEASPIGAGFRLRLARLNFDGLYETTF